MPEKNQDKVNPPDERWSDWADGRLSPEKARALEGEMKDVGRFEEMEAFGRFVKSLQATPEEALPVGMTGRIMAEIKGATSSNIHRGRPFFPYILSFASAAAAILLLYFSAPGLFRGNEKEPMDREIAKVAPVIKVENMAPKAPSGLPKVEKSLSKNKFMLKSGGSSWTSRKKENALKKQGKREEREFDKDTLNYKLSLKRGERLLKEKDSSKKGGEENKKDSKFKEGASPLAGKLKRIGLLGGGRSPSKKTRARRGKSLERKKAHTPFVRGVPAPNARGALKADKSKSAIQSRPIQVVIVPSLNALDFKPFIKAGGKVERKSLPYQVVVKFYKGSSFKDAWLYRLAGPKGVTKSFYKRFLATYAYSGTSHVPFSIAIKGSSKKAFEIELLILVDRK